MNNELLFSEFEPTSAKAWKQKIQYDLKGADYNATLIGETFEGIPIKPFYTAEDIENLPRLQFSPHRKWNIGQKIHCDDADQANKKALDILGRGASALVLEIPDPEINWAVLLKEIDLKTIPIYFNFEFPEKSTITTLLDYVGNTAVQFFLNIDSVGNFAGSGNWYKSRENDEQLLKEILELTASKDGIVPLCVEMSLYQNAGAHSVQQLAYGLAHANEYINQHHDYFASGKAMIFKVSVGGNYFFEIAKLRALRWLWATLTKEYKLPSDCHILAFPSRRNKTLYDYNVNMLRTTSECMAAVLGGADTICNLPYDVLYHKENEFGERIARNQLLLLKEESYFDEAKTAAEGSYYIETLTYQLADKALELFKQLETAGGFLAALKKGNIQKKIKESAAREQELFDSGQLMLLGSNAYQNPEDHIKNDLELDPFVTINKRKTEIAPIIEKRLTEELERKRLENE